MAIDKLLTISKPSLIEKLPPETRVIPKTLSETSVKDSPPLISKIKLLLEPRVNLDVN